MTWWRIRVSTRRIETVALSHEVCLTLMTVPGIGPSVAVRFVAAIDDVSRFDSAEKVAAYLGLQHAVDLAATWTKLHSRATVEYWKSAPYLVNFMRAMPDLKPTESQ